jgi:hypothetical protein
MPVTINQIKTAGVNAAAELGYAVISVASRLNANASTQFLWTLTKDGKRYMMENTVMLYNVRPADLPTFARVFKQDMNNAKEY